MFLIRAETKLIRGGFLRWGLDGGGVMTEVVWVDKVNSVLATYLEYGELL